jgi:hypothetical protein
MESNTARPPAVGSAGRALLAGLIDHAALFPPASMSLGDALAEDRRARTGAERWLLGRFICPASRLDELGADASRPLSVVLDGAGAAGGDGWVAALESDLAAVSEAKAAGAAIELLEVKVPDPALVADGAEPMQGLGFPYFEVPPDSGWEAPLAAAGAGAKLRCGGLTAAAFPSVEQVARFIVRCRDAGIRFKATAGLHHPIRHTDAATGFQMHGFLNLLAAAVFAHAEELEEAQLARLLAEEDPAALAVGEAELSAHGRRADAEAIAAARTELFAGYGSCSFAEPVEDLQALGILPA